MKHLTKTLAAGLLAAVLSLPLALQAADAKKETPKPYPLKTCIVSDEALDSMGEAYVFTHEGREIKMCCKSCDKDFKKEPAKYIKKLEAAEKKPAPPAKPAEGGQAR